MQKQMSTSQRPLVQTELVTVFVTCINQWLNFTGISQHTFVILRNVGVSADLDDLYKVLVIGK